MSFGNQRGEGRVTEKVTLIDKKKGDMKGEDR